MKCSATSATKFVSLRTPSDYRACVGASHRNGGAEGAWTKQTHIPFPNQNCIPLAISLRWKQQRHRRELLCAYQRGCSTQPLIHAIISKDCRREANHLHPREA